MANRSRECIGRAANRHDRSVFRRSMRSLAVSVILSTIVASAAPLVGQRSGCGPTQRPHQLPAVQALLDSSAAIMELQAAHLLRDSMQFTLLVLAGDSQPVIHALDSTDHVAADVIARSAWPQKPAELWAVRLHVTGGAAPALTVTRATYCPPQLAPVPGRTRRAEMGVLREERVVTTSGSGTRTVLGVPPTL